MEIEKPAVNTTVPAAAPIVDDAQTRIAALEAEKAKLMEEGANWKVAALKYKKDAKEDVVPDEDDKMRQIVKQEIAESRVAEIMREQDAIIQQALKENKELKLARSKPNDPPAAFGSHSESVPVRDTVVSAEQLNAFKSRGWTDKDIERYKKNLNRYSGR